MGSFLKKNAFKCVVCCKFRILLLCGALYSENEEHFTFVLTDLDSNYRFGFCFYRPKADTCMCFIRYYNNIMYILHTPPIVLL